MTFFFFPPLLFFSPFFLLLAPGHNSEIRGNTIDVPPPLATTVRALRFCIARRLQPFLPSSRRLAASDQKAILVAVVLRTVPPNAARQR